MVKKKTRKKKTESLGFLKPEAPQPPQPSRRFISRWRRDSNLVLLRNRFANPATGRYTSSAHDRRRMSRHHLQKKERTIAAKEEAFQLLTVVRSGVDGGTPSGHYKTYSENDVVFGIRANCPHLRVSIRDSISRLESFFMRNEYLDKVEDNASVCTWSEKTQLEKGDSVTEGYTSELWDFTHIKVDKHRFRAKVQFWNPAYSCFTFVEAAARIQQKGDGKYIPWASLRDLILVHPDVKRRVNVLALSIYGLVIFPKAMGHIYEAVGDLFDRLGKQNTPVPLLLVWFHSHFWKVDKVPYRVFFKDYSPLKEAAATPRRDDITEERWIEILQNLREEDVMWKAPWMTPSEILYRCGNFDWVPLPGIWGVVGYAPLLVLRQYKAEQFIPATQGLAQSDFSYKGDHYKKKMRETFEA
ncbi:hypothetical protein CXB51_034127 [Gossypium anomalum]|uniref:DUF7745 domain-containing protein n=1 Tax=Gossypium anomalum TaxID=47600 RepID=A0A8J5Y010_9ROSI|nr:hypothetical protein CXB51_034127 [Gossypium anomalum]